MKPRKLTRVEWKNKGVPRERLLTCRTKVLGGGRKALNKSSVNGEFRKCHYKGLLANLRKETRTLPIELVV